MDAEYVRDGAELAIADMLTSGTTCFADMHLFPEVTAQAASAAKIRACIGLPVADTPSPWAGSANECLAKGIALHDEYRDDPLITTALAPGPGFERRRNAPARAPRGRRAGVAGDDAAGRGALARQPRPQAGAEPAGAARIAVAAPDSRARSRARRRRSRAAEPRRRQRRSLRPIGDETRAQRMPGGGAQDAQRELGARHGRGRLQQRPRACSAKCGPRHSRRAGCFRRFRPFPRTTGCAQRRSAEPGLSGSQKSPARSSRASGRTSAVST